MYRALLLDVYGTLVHDDDEALAPVCATVAATAGVDAALVRREWLAGTCAAADLAHGAAFRTLADLTVAGLAGTAAALGVRVDATGLCRDLLASWRRPPLFPDAARFLGAVDLPVCLVSDADRDDLRAVLALHGIAVEAVVTSEDARAYKPRPEPFRLALAALGVDARDVVHVGDSPSSDIAGAAALGIDTVLLDRGGHPLPPGTTATRTVPSLTALPPLLRTAAPSGR